MRSPKMYYIGFSKKLSLGDTKVRKDNGKDPGIPRDSFKLKRRLERGG